MHSNTLKEAKQRLTIFDIWKHYNLPGKPSKSCRTPWREDYKPSFSVKEDGSLWNDFGTGEGGDAIDFLARVCRIDKPAACRTFLDMAGPRFLAPVKHSIPKATEPIPRSKPRLPEMRIGTSEELQVLAKLRGIGRQGLEWAAERGLLWFATLKDYPAWIVTDGERVNAQGRRLDGQVWQHLNGAKAYTLPGSWASWPIGIKEAREFSAIALCEGGPDFLAAHYLALFEQASHYTKRDAQCAPVVMLGATQRIHPNALPLFAGKRVRIFCHADEAGLKSARQWAEQLATVNVKADACDFSGLKRADDKPAKDLNDYLLMKVHGFDQTERILP